MGELSQSDGPAGQQREAGSIRTALPSRPMSSKPRDGPSTSNHEQGASLRNDPPGSRPSNGSLSPSLQDTPMKDASVSPRARSPVSTVATTQTLTPEGAQGQGGQKCSNCGTTRTPLWRRSPQGATICNACGLYLKARNAARPTGLKKPPNVVQERTVQPSPPTAPSASGSKSSANVAGATYVAAEQTPTGTCPGGGRCNGTGGAEGCHGCPAFNNRLAKSAHLKFKQRGGGCQSREEEPPAENEPTPVDVNAMQAQQNNNDTTVVIACQNCGTTVTPLWRRDASGHTICNACGLCNPSIAAA
jgi:GATA-binding protein